MKTQFFLQYQFTFSLQREIYVKVRTDINYPDINISKSSFDTFTPKK